MTILERKYIYYLQNQHIAKHGAIAFQRIPEDVMAKTVQENTTLLEWMQSHERILQIEKSGTPGIQKWWIITRLENRQELETYLDTMVKDNFSNFHLNRQQYVSPKEIKPKYQIRELTKEQSTNLQKFQDRLTIRARTVKPITEAPHQGHKHRTYETVTAPKKLGTSTKSTNMEIKELKQMMEKQTMNIQQITTQAWTIATSSLTPDTTLTDAIKQITEQQNEQFRRMMHDMMPSVFQQMFSLIQTMLPPQIPPQRQGMGIPECEILGMYIPFAGSTNPNPILMTPQNHSSPEAPKLHLTHFPNLQSMVVGTE